MSKTISLVSWNVNGIRAAEKKGFLDWFHENSYDIVCLQETKAHVEQLSHKLVHPDGYESYWSSAIRKGYSGTVIYTRISPILSQTTFSDPYLDGEGRIVMLEFENFFLFNVYFPNGGSGEERLAFKLEFYNRFLKLIEEYRKQKPIVVCGDVNTAHTEIDLARPKENAHVSGFMPKEREWVSKLISHGYHDTFRIFSEEANQYTWWDMKSGARARNVGWRIDYFFVSNELKSKVKSAWIDAAQMGSDHCPVGITIENKH